jgi:hypothetical protein
VPGAVGAFLCRYHNHLDASIVGGEWKAAEEELLFAMHEEVGNKWSAIAQKLPGRQVPTYSGLTTASRITSTRDFARPSEDWRDWRRRHFRNNSAP